MEGSGARQGAGSGEEGAAGVLDDAVRPGGETTMEGEGQKNGRSPLKLTLRLPRPCMTISLGFFYGLPQWNPGMPVFEGIGARRGRRKSYRLEMELVISLLKP